MNISRPVLPCLLALAVPASAISAGAPDLRPGEVQNVLVLPPGDIPEGVAIGGDGALYIGNRRVVGGVREAELLKMTGDGAATVIATFEGTAVQGAAGLLGLAVDRDGDVFAALDSKLATSHGVWKVTANGRQVQRIPGSEQMLFPNALTFDQAGNLYATDSAGAIWRMPAGARQMSAWTQDDLLAPDPTDPLGIPLPGANGIAFFPPDRLYVANTEKGLIVRVLINADGSAGPVSVAAASLALLTVDGIAVDVQGGIHGVIAGYAVTGSSPVVHVDPATRTVSPGVIDPAEIAEFDVPLSLVFGNSGKDLRSVYVVNSDLPIVPGGPGAGIVEVGVGISGYRGN